MPMDILGDSINAMTAYRQNTGRASSPTQMTLSGQQTGSLYGPPGAQPPPFATPPPVMFPGQGGQMGAGPREAGMSPARQRYLKGAQMPRNPASQGLHAYLRTIAGVN